MKEFLIGWRRKIGVVSLLVALVFTVSWVRSFSYSDVCALQLPSMTFAVMSNADGLVGSVFKYVGTQGIPCEILWPTSIGDAYAERVCPEWFDWHAEFYGNQFCEKGYSGQSSDPIRIRVLVVRHPFIVVPLTLISLWFLLSKPLKLTPKKIPEPISNERA